MTINKINFRLVIILFIGFLSINSYSQLHIHSPYSQFGIGQLSLSNQVYYHSMGGVGYAISHPSYINIANPASNVALLPSSFIFEVGIESNSTTLKTKNLSESTSYSSLNYLLFGFSISQRWKTSFGVLPFSKVGYSVSDNILIENVGLTEHYYEGYGGINQCYWGNAFKISDNFSIGISAHYLFGTITKFRNTSFPDSIFVLTSQIDEITTINDFYFDYGIQYSKKLKNNHKLSFGLTFSNSTKINIKSNYLSKTFLYNSEQHIEYLTDTLDYSPTKKGTFLLPSKIGFGIALEKSRKWLVAADFDWQNWKKFKSFNISDSLKNSYKIAIGGHFTPNYTSISSYWKRVNYRFGFRFLKSYLELRGNNINEIGFSFGMGLPLRKSSTTINFGIEVGNRGTINDDLIQENFINFKFGISLHNIWFFKTKYH